MDESVVSDALGAHMDALERLFNWAFFIAVGVAWAGLRGERKIELGNISFERKIAFYVVAGLFFAANVVLLIWFAQVEALLRLLPDAAFVEGYSRVATHQWILNPFAFFGASLQARLSASWGIAALVLVWWFCLAAVWSLRGREPVLKSVAFPFLFYLAGLVTLWQFSRIYVLNIERLEALAPVAAVAAEILRGLRETSQWRWSAIFASVPVGLAYFIVLLNLRRIRIYRRRRRLARARRTKHKPHDARNALAR